MNTLYVLVVLAASVFGSEDIEDNCLNGACTLMYPSSNYSNILEPDVKHLALWFCSDLELLHLTPNLLSLQLESCDSDFNMEFLSVVTNITSLAFRKSHLLELNNYHFAKMINLNLLDLEGNSIERFSNDTFYNLSRLTQLYLQNNLITVLPEAVFYPLDSLEFLDLTNNSISVLTENIFSRNSMLRELYLNENPLTLIVFPTRPPYLVIHTLDLNDCGTLKEMRLSINVNTLYLRNTGLERLQITGSIGYDIVHENSKLTHADFHGTILKETGFIYILICVRSLEWLDVSNTSIRNTFFDFYSPHVNECTYPNLRFLNVSDNKLEYIPRRFLLLVPNLTTLDLSHNSLKTVSLESFGQALSLQSLHLEDNQLTSFDHLSVCDGLRHLKELALYDNHFNATFYDDMTKYFGDKDLHLIQKKDKMYIESEDQDKNKPLIPKANETLPGSLDLTENLIPKANLNPRRTSCNISDTIKLFNLHYYVCIFFFVYLMF